MDALACSFGRQFVKPNFRGSPTQTIVCDAQPCVYPAMACCDPYTQGNWNGTIICGPLVLVVRLLVIVFSLTIRTPHRPILVRQLLSFPTVLVAAFSEASGPLGRTAHAMIHADTAEFRQRLALVSLRATAAHARMFNSKYVMLFQWTKHQGCRMSRNHLSLPKKHMLSWKQIQKNHCECNLCLRAVLGMSHCKVSKP